MTTTAVIQKSRCRICKIVIEHKLLSEFKDLPPGIGVFSCRGCGVLGIIPIWIEPQ